MSDKRFSNDSILEIMVTVFAAFTMLSLFLKMLFF